MSFGHKTQPFSFLGKKSGGGFFQGFTGADGDLTVLNGQDITLPVKAGNLYDYNNVIIQAGGILRLPTNGGQIFTFGALSLQNDGTFYGDKGEHAGMSDSIITVAGDNFSYSQSQQAGGRAGRLTTSCVPSSGTPAEGSPAFGNGGASFEVRSSISACMNSPSCSPQFRGCDDAIFSRGANGGIGRVYDNNPTGAIPEGLCSFDSNSNSMQQKVYAQGWSRGAVNYGENGGDSAVLLQGKGGVSLFSAGGGFRGRHGQACVFYVSILSGTGTFNFNGGNATRGGWGFNFNSNRLYGRRQATFVDPGSPLTDISDRIGFYTGQNYDNFLAGGGGAGGNGGFVRLKSTTNNFSGSWQVGGGARGGTPNPNVIEGGEQGVQIRSDVYVQANTIMPTGGSNGLAGSFANF